ncbi:MAG: limonene-1,2-epoxide hydrolase family protein [Acidimicrobiales bacterium]
MTAAGDPTSPAELVRSFCDAWPAEPATLAAYFADDAVYHNIPLEPIRGRAAIEEAFVGFAAMAPQIRFETRHLVADGDLVMTERVDHFTNDQGTISLPVMGAFEVRQGRIVAWRDYFDLAQFTSQMGGGG